MFGGTFDPIHNGHIRAAEEIIAQQLASKVIFLPAGSPWQKGGKLVASPIDRAALVAKAIATNPKFQLSTREIERSGATYTIDTVREYQQEFPTEDFLLLLGSDAFNGINTWHEHKELLQSIDIVVAIRPGEKVIKVPDAHVSVIESEMFDISSTQIRHAAKTGANLAQFVPGVIVDEVKRIYGT